MISLQRYRTTPGSEAQGDKTETEIIRAAENASRQTAGGALKEKPAKITARPTSVFKPNLRSIWKQLMALGDEGRREKKEKKKSASNTSERRSSLLQGVQSTSSLNPLNFNPYVVYHANIQSAISPDPL